MGELLSHRSQKQSTHACSSFCHVSTGAEASTSGRDDTVHVKAGVVESLDSVRIRVAQAVKDADSNMKALLQRTWCLGPRNCGPNVLLASEGSKTSSLFNAPAANLVHLSKRAGILQTTDF